MHEILKRALDEALTAAYAGEIPAEAEEVAFSEGFEWEMRGLIRKTDRPIQKYIPILTAAACAVIAIGCAVLLPRLLSHSIPVEPDEISTVTVTSTAPSTAPTDEPAESTSTAETTPDEPTAIQDENPGAADAISEVNEEDTTEWDDEDGGADGENGVPVLTGSSGLTVEPDPQEPNEIPQTGISDGEAATAGGEDDQDDDAVDEETEVDDEDDGENILIDDDVNPGSAGDVPIDDGDDDDDDDVVWVDSDDDDVASDDSEESDMDFDNDEETNESELPPIEKRATLNEEVETLLGCSLADSYLHSGNFMIDGKFYDVPIVEGIDPETYRDPALAERIGAAKLIDGEPEERGLPLFWGNIGAKPPVIKPVYESDQSDRNHYDELYFEGDRWIEDEDEDDEDDEPTVYLEFLRNGIVCVFRDGYPGSAYYQLDDETTEALIERIETRFRVSEPKTVGDLMKQLGSAEDYAQVYVGIRDYYDCTMNGALSDGTFFAELLQKYKKAKLSEVPYRSGAPIQIAVTSRKSLREYNFIFYADGTVLLWGEKAFTVDPSELRAILTEYCRQKNLPAPFFYETLGEYLEGKNFTALTYVWLYGTDMSGDLSLAGDDAEIRALIEKYAMESAFLPSGDGVSYREQGSIEIQVEGWFPSLRISRDEIQIGNTRNIFRTPDGLYEALCAILSEKGESPYAGQDEDYWDDDVAEEVTDD